MYVYIVHAREFTCMCTTHMYIYIDMYMYMSKYKKPPLKPLQLKREMRSFICT